MTEQHDDDAKALVEKLLRSCKDIRRIYLLIREKRGKSPKERLAELIKSSQVSRFARINSILALAVAPLARTLF